MSRWSPVRRLAADGGTLLDLSARLLIGRRYWIAVLLPLVWPGFQALRLAIGWRESVFGPADVQNILLGVPLVVLAIGLGVRVIAGELDRRTLEIAYTVPGGAHRVWLGKLFAAALVLAAAEVLLAAVSYVLFTAVTPGALWGAYQAALVYLVLAAWFAALGRSEVTGAMATAGLLMLNALFTGFGDMQTRLSPFFNPLAVEDASPADVLAWTVQNRIGFALVVVAVAALAFARAERREKLLTA